MRRRVILAMVGSFLFSIGLILFLVALSGMLKDRRNSFLRIFPSHVVTEEQAYDLNSNYYYLAGGTAHNIYLANYRSPLYLLKIDLQTRDTSIIRMEVKGIMDQKFWSARVKVDSPYFYLADGAVPKIYVGNMNNWTATEFPYDREYFLGWTPTGPRSFAINSLDKYTGERKLGRISEDSPHYYYDPKLLTKQVDGVFCTDGMMNYSKALGKVIYVYRYRNQYLVADTTLKNVYHGNTLDTVAHAQIKVGFVRNGATRVMIQPPLSVNHSSAVSDNWLFVNSSLIAKNEHPDAQQEAAVIDVYNLLNVKYLFSFYLFHYNGKEKLTTFGVYGNHLVAVYGTHVQIFSLRKKYFEPDNPDKNLASIQQ